MGIPEIVEADLGYASPLNEPTKNQVVKPDSMTMTILKGHQS